MSLLLQNNSDLYVKHKKRIRNEGDIFFLKSILLNYNCCEVVVYGILWHFFHIVLPTYQWLCSETYFINFNAYNEFLCLQCQFQCLKWILVLTMLPISIVPTGQFFVVRMIHEASRLSHLSPQFIKKNPSNF